jgi:molecular chaperone DnaK
VDARNRAEGLIHSVQKSVKDMGDKLDAAEKDKIEAAIKDLEGVLTGDDKEAIDTKTQTLTEASHKLAEQMYAQAQAAAGATETQSAGAGEGTTSGKANDNVVDAEFEEVKDNNKKK